MPSYTSDVELRNALGIESWRNLSKDTFVGFLERLPEVDPEVALKLIDQVPEITTLARGTVEDATKAYDTALEANAHGQDAVDQIHRQRLEILRAELEKDLTPEQWTRVLDDMREINVNALLKDTENKKFISDQFHATLATVGAAVVAVGAVVFVAIKSGDKSGGFLKS
jgi:hypothetical protein